MKKTLFCLFCVMGIITVQAQTVVLKKGTKIQLQSTDNVGLDNYSNGESIEFRVGMDVVVSGVTIIPRGTIAIGEIVSVSNKRSTGPSMFSMLSSKKLKENFRYKLSYVVMPSGEHIPLEEKKIKIEGDMPPQGRLVFDFRNEETIERAMLKKGAVVTGVIASDYSYNAPKPVIKETPVQAPAKNSVVTSDIDQNIPTTSSTAENSFAVIIANEKYSNESQVEYAINDGRTFKEYCRKTLGLPSINIHYRENATKNNIEQEIDWVTKVAEAYGNDAQIIIYYAGHGIPDEETSTAYLLPVDGIGNNIKTGYSLISLYDKLSSLPARNVIVLMDACFSGTKRGEGMLTSARGVAIKAKATQPQGNLLVFSAAQGKETAYPYQEKGHGMFTYFLLKKLQETKGNCTLGELGDYVKSQVARRSIVVNGKSQTPTMEPSPSLTDNWRKIKLR